MFKLEQGKKQVTVETGNAIYKWDADRSGCLTEFILKEGKRQHQIIDPSISPDIILNVDGQNINLSRYKTEFTPIYEEKGYVIFSTSCNIDDKLTFEQQYEVHESSCVFCEFRIMVNEGQKLRIKDADIKFTLNLCDAKNVKANYFSRDLYIKQDLTVPHILGTINLAKDRGETIEEDHALPLLGLDLGWGNTRHYSNRVELILEDSTTIGNDMLGEASTCSKEENGVWHHTLNVARNVDEEFEAPYFYRNKWALLCGSGRTESGPGAEMTRRNNAMGAKICHVMYPYVYAERNWPWSSVPLKQCFYQDVQIATELPGLERLDEAAKQGANTIIIHQFWMSCGGSNGEPQASYIPHDPEWMKAFIDKAHNMGMKVLLYVRGIEQYQLYMNFFEEYLEKDRDGLYMDWAAPFLMGFCKSTTRHSSVYNYFMFIKALRARVGENGLLIGHTMMQTCVSYSQFDVALTGEFSVLHTGLLAEPEISTSYTGQSCCGIHLIAGNAPDRRAFSSQQAVGYAAALGWGNHPFMEPGVDFTHSSDFTKPLWNLLDCLESAPVKTINPSIESNDFMTFSDERLYPLAYEDNKGNWLVMVTNLSKETINGEVMLNLDEIGCAGASVEVLDVPGIHKAEIVGNKIILRSIQPYFFCGVIIRKK